MDMALDLTDAEQLIEGLGVGVGDARRGRAPVGRKAANAPSRVHCSCSTSFVMRSTGGPCYGCARGLNRLNRVVLARDFIAATAAPSN